MRSFVHSLIQQIVHWSTHVLVYSYSFIRVLGVVGQTVLKFLLEFGDISPRLHFDAVSGGGGHRAVNLVKFPS